LATPNYSFQKRQRELAKKRKAEEKRNRKLGQAEGGAPADDPTKQDTADGSLPSSTTTDPST
jgi:hypothetical protein